MARTAKPTAIAPPNHLAGPAKDFWASTQAVYGIEDPAGLRLLRLACEALTTAEKARLVIERDGLVYEDRFGAPRPRPEVRIQATAMTTFRALVRELRLDSIQETKR